MSTYGQVRWGMEDFQQNKPVRQVKWLSQALLISGALNIGLVATFFYLLLVKEQKLEDYWHRPVGAAAKATPLADGRSNAEVLNYFESLSFDQLIGKLENAQPVEDGYSQRDLSLACLVQKFQFHLERALGGVPPQKRLLQWQLPNGETKEVMVYPGLNDESFRAIVRFAMTERWPLTAKGLFTQLKRSEHCQEKSLLEAFYLTPEFLEVETLLEHARAPIRRERIVAMLREGDFAMLEAFANNQRQTQDFSAARRQHFLFSYVAKGSRAAAYLLVETDGYYLARKCTNAQVMQLLDLFTEKTNAVQDFAIELLQSPRSDAVWRKAAARLYAFGGEAMPEPFDHTAALAHFVEPLSSSVPAVSAQLPVAESPKEILSRRQEEPVSQPKRKVERLYVVQDFDNLWKIARKYEVPVDMLRTYNQLTSDNLKVGQVLKIPAVSEG